MVISELEAMVAHYKNSVTARTTVCWT